jgi:hypothetical protein
MDVCWDFNGLWGVHSGGDALICVAPGQDKKATFITKVGVYVQCLKCLHSSGVCVCVCVCYTQGFIDTYNPGMFYLCFQNLPRTKFTQVSGREVHGIGCFFFLT